MLGWWPYVPGSGSGRGRAEGGRAWLDPNARGPATPAEHGCAACARERHPPEYLHALLWWQWAPAIPVQLAQQAAALATATQQHLGNDLTPSPFLAFLWETHVLQLLAGQLHATGEHELAERLTRQASRADLALTQPPRRRVRFLQRLVALYAGHLHTVLAWEAATAPAPSDTAHADPVAAY